MDEDGQCTKSGGNALRVEVKGVIAHLSRSSGKTLTNFSGKYLRVGCSGEHEFFWPEVVQEVKRSLRGQK